MSGSSGKGARVAPCTLVIATADRPDDLSVTLESWRAGTQVPHEVRIVDASADDRTEALCSQDLSPLCVRYCRSAVRSAAVQRNLGADGCETPFIAFCDDDIAVPPNALSDLLEVFERERVGGVGGVIEGYSATIPGRIARLYFRVQAGYPHEHYGGRFFGAAINRLHTDRPDDPILYPTEWLNSCLVVYRTALFEGLRFPRFDGYSYQEDVNLSARMGKTHQLFFHRGVRYKHFSRPGKHKSDPYQMGRMQVTNRWWNASEVLGLSWWSLRWKFFLSLMFESLSLLRAGAPGGLRHMRGALSAWWHLTLRGRDGSA